MDAMSLPTAAASTAAAPNPAAAVKVLLVPPTPGEPAAVLVINDLDDEYLRNVVSDINTDTIFHTRGSGITVCGAHAQQSHALINAAATRLTEMFRPGFTTRDRIYGTAIFLSVRSQTHDPAVDPNATRPGVWDDVTPDVIEVATTLGILPGPPR